MDIVHSVYQALQSDRLDYFSQARVDCALTWCANSDTADYKLDLNRLMANHSDLDETSIVSELEKNLSDQFATVVLVGDQIYLSLSRQDALDQLNKMAEGSDWPYYNYQDQETYTIDMSSPNLGKTMTLTHLRSTTIGQSLFLLLNKMGQQAFRINHLGDWGIRFARLILAYETWGLPDDCANPNVAFVDLQNRFYEESEFNPDLDTKAAVVFNRLSHHDSEIEVIWKELCERSYQQFAELYDLMGVSFESIKGESAYNEETVALRQALVDSGITKRDLDALTVTFPIESGIPAALIQTRENDSLYLTRDLAAAIERQRDFAADYNLYIVGNEQATHFDQLKGILSMLGYDWSDSIDHLALGFNSYKGRRLINSHGEVISVRRLFDKVAWRLKKLDPTLGDDEAVRLAVNLVTFESLKNDRLEPFDLNTNDLVFSEEENILDILQSVEQVSSMRTKERETGAVITHEQWQFAHLALSYPYQIRQAVANFEPSIIADYVISLYKAYEELLVKQMTSQQIDNIYKSLLCEMLTLLGLQVDL
ncbi:arginine--tRNA ligase [Aerococcus kribbianus]|uniref:Arginine--tRNA ligase n=1 Tax=Aerococcus kribbianus TaxID=2999064 RepID=A0A9X3FNY0_9LACT|nr:MULTISPECIES: arginine--tRNA ligase [unclassified Aerococcus]MCZ0718111.1 arginine--tRNA ligase [Aerococcus sp. YH-aer221]MCZ0726320.1 arginine--tRNA ligase [Aerococcus sp. YH-aer222]